MFKAAILSSLLVVNNAAITGEYSKKKGERKLFIWKKYLFEILFLEMELKLLSSHFNGICLN